MMGRTLGGGVRTELEANLNAAGALERYQYWSDKLERLLQQQRSRASHDRHQPQSPSDYRHSSERERARERVCFAQKPIAATKMGMWRSYWVPHLWLQSAPMTGPRQWQRLTDEQLQAIYPKSQPNPQP